MPDTDMTTDPLLADVPVCEGYKTLGGVVLYEKLGQGGMGAVYKGRHLRLDIDVAVKVMAPPTGVAQTAADNFIQRFIREAKTAASVKHQNLIRVMDVNTEAGVYYLVMDYIDGESAADRLKRKGVLSEVEALEVCLGAAGGLSQAHAKGIVHRDVKPDNIMIDRDGGVVVADLGLAKAYGADEDDTGMGLSMSQQAMGTPYYMSPEQSRSARDVGPSADVWSLGVTLYQLLTNTVPWPITDLAELIMQIRNTSPPDIRAACPGLSDGTREIIEKAMSKEPSERYVDCREMAAAVRTHLDAVRSSPGSALPDTEAGSTKMALVTVPAPPQNTLTLIAASMVGGAPGGAGAAAKAAGTWEAGVPLKVRGVVSLKEPGAAAVGLGVTPPTMAPRATSARTWAVMLAVGALILLAGAGIAALVYSHYAELERKADEEKEAWRTAREDVRAKAAKWDYDGAIGKVDAFLAAAQIEKVRGEAEGLKKELLLAKADFEHDGTAWLEVRSAAEVKASEEDYQGAIAAVDGFLASARTERFRPQANDLRRDLARRKAVREEARLQARLEKEARLREEQRKLEEARRAAREKVGTLLAAARTLREKGLLDQARDRLSEALAADPEHAEAARLLTQVQADIAGKKAGAERASEYRKWMNEGLRFRVGGKLEEAAQAYDQASQLAPAGNKEAAEAAGVCRHDRFRAQAEEAGKAGKLADGIKLYEKALSYKDDPDTRRALEEMRKAVQTEKERLAAQAEWKSKAEEAEGRGDLRVALACYRKAAGYGADQERPGSTGVAKKISLLEREVEFRDGLAGARSLFVEGNWREARSVASEILKAGADAPEAARQEASSLLEEIEAEYGPWGPLLTIDFGSGVRKMELAYVKPGLFRMGSEAGARDERPVREVAITKGFYIGRHEVTQTQYYVLTRADPSYFKGTDQPVEKVTWHEAVRYCSRLSQFTGKVARLPTEAEWEYACRAAAGNSKQGGEWCFVDEEGKKDGKLSHYAWYGGKTAFAKTHPVGQKKPNPWGLHDMHGNVWEWCSDWYDKKYYAKGPQEDPTGPAAGKARALRGGSFSNGAKTCRSATRDAKKPDYRKLYVGFRVVIEAETPQAGGAGVPGAE